MRCTIHIERLESCTSELIPKESGWKQVYKNKCFLLKGVNALPQIFPVQSNTALLDHSEKFEEDHWLSPSGSNPCQVEHNFHYQMDVDS